MSSGPSKVIVLDPDPRAGRQVQLGFEREGVPVLVPALTDAGAPLDIAAEPGLVLVGGGDGATGLDLVRRAKAWLTTKGADVPIVFTGRGPARRELEAAGANEVIARPAFLRDVVTIARMLRGVPHDQRAHLTGSLVETTGVLTLVRAFSALGRSAVLTLIRGLRRGEVRFFHGEVTSAQVGLIHGQAALHQLLLWTDARFDYSHEDIVRRQQIPLSAEELFADAEQFLEGVREHAGSLSPATILEQDITRVHALGKQIPTEVHGVLRMFDGHRVLADILEDSPYRVFETLRVAEKAVEVGLLREVSSQRPKATWRAVLAIEEWLVGSETRDAVVERTQTLDSGPLKASPSPAPRKGKKQRKGKRRSKLLKAAAPPSDRKGDEIDWGALVPRVIGAEVGPLSGVVPSHAAHGEVELPRRDAPREGLEALMDTQKRQRIFPTDIGLEPKVVIESSVGGDGGESERAELRAKQEKAVAEAKAAAQRAAETAAADKVAAEKAAAERTAAERAQQQDADVLSETAAKIREQAPKKRKRAERGDDLTPEADATVDASAPAATSETVNTARHAAPPPPAAAPAIEPGAASATAPTRIGGDTARIAAPLRPPAMAAPRMSDPALAPIAESATEPAVAKKRAPTNGSKRASTGPGDVDSAMASLVAVPTYVEPMKSDPVAAVTAVPADVSERREIRPGATDASALVRALVAEAVPPSDATATASGPVPSAASDAPSEAVTAPLPGGVDEAVTAPVATLTTSAASTSSSTASTLVTAFEKVAAPATEPAPSASALIAEPITVAEARATSVAVADVMTVTGSAETAIVTASPRLLISEQPAVAPLASMEPARTASTPEPPVTPTAAAPTAAAPTIDAAHATAARAAEPVKPAKPDDATPIATDDEPSDGVVRAIVATADTARVSRRLRPPAPEHDGPPIKETTGEIRERARRETKEPTVAEPSILVADLAAAHEAIAAVVAKPPVAQAPPADAASPSRELEVGGVRRDAVAFSEAEEAFFRGAERTAPAPKVETFDDLDEGYQPPGFWDRVFGRKKPK